MARETIDFGIDLGTTTSAIAEAMADDARVIRNNRQAEYTPSAVYVEPVETKSRVGEAAKARVEVGSGKRLRRVQAPDGGARRAQAIRGVRAKHDPGGVVRRGAEIAPWQRIQPHREDNRRRRDHRARRVRTSTSATPPAERAAQAGLAFAPLIQEPERGRLGRTARTRHPVAVSGWSTTFGGGTFDAAVVRVADGRIQSCHACRGQLSRREADRLGAGGRCADPDRARECELTSIVRGRSESLGNVAKLKLRRSTRRSSMSRVDNRRARSVAGRRFRRQCRNHL